MASARPGYEACSGCSLCLLACPVWRATRDIRLTPHGRAKALQHGAGAEDLEQSIDSCTLCGACEPACPEEIGLVAMVTGLRAELARRVPQRVAEITGQMAARSRRTGKGGAGGDCVFVPGRSIAGDAALLGRVGRLLQASDRAAVAEDGGADIARALEAGAAVPEARLAAFLAPLRGARRLIVGDGMLIRALRDWLPAMAIENLGVALSAAVRQGLRPGDFYVIGSGAYHTDQERLVKYYDAMRVAIGLNMNLDLQRLAMPTTAGSLATALGQSRVDPRDQARWMLSGYEHTRVVVEDANDIAAFSAVTGKPVIHLAELG